MESLFTYTSTIRRYGFCVSSTFLIAQHCNESTLPATVKINFKWITNNNNSVALVRPPLWSSGQRSWLQIQRSGSFIQRIRPGPRLYFILRNKFIFYSEGLLAPCPTRKLEDHPLSFVRGCLFNIFAASLHSWRPFLHPQPEDAPCCGDRDPPNMETCGTLPDFASHHYQQDF
jgi:hypothetical protein